MRHPADSRPDSFTYILVGAIALLLAMAMTACEDANEHLVCTERDVQSGRCLEWAVPTPRPPAEPTPHPSPPPGTCVLQIVVLHVQPVFGTTDVWEFWIDPFPGGPVGTPFNLVIDGQTYGGLTGGKQAIHVGGTGPHQAFARGACLLSEPVPF